MINYLRFPIVFLLISLTCVSCSRQKSVDEKWQDLKKADFANLLENAYDFIETPYFDSICGRLNDTILSKNYVQIEIKDLIDTVKQIVDNEYLVYDDSYFKDLEFSLRHRNILRVCVINKDSIMINDILHQPESFKLVGKEFISNPTSREDYSEHRQVHIDLLGIVRVPKGILSIRTFHGYQKPMNVTDWELYFRIINSFHKAYFELTNEFALFQWNEKYDELEFERKVAMTKLYPTNIELNFMRHCGNSIPSPPPPADIQNLLNIVDEE